MFLLEGALPISTIRAPERDLILSCIVGQMLCRSLTNLRVLNYLYDSCERRSAPTAVVLKLTALFWLTAPPNDACPPQLILRAKSRTCALLTSQVFFKHEPQNQ